MNFTPELSALQGVIISADNVYPFSRLTEKGGNEEKITFIVSNILKFLQERNFIDEGLIEKMVPETRKFSLYIILNANLKSLEELVDKEEIDLVIWTIPTIPKLLMCEFIYNLHMEKFLYEVIVYSYPPLGLEVAAAFLDHFKYFSPINCLDQIRRMSVACYTLICRLHLFNFAENYSNNLTNASNNFQKSIKHFIDPPNSGKLTALRKNDLYKYKGRRLTSALLFVCECLSQFTSKQGKKLSTVEDLYQLTYRQGAIKEDITIYNVSDSSKEILDLLNECNEMMLDACKQLVMDVSVDIFCAWSEFEENGKTMQQSIGELCHKLRTKLLNISSVSEHPLVSMIQQIARKPADIKDLINSTDVATIKEKINNNNNEDYKVWLKALIDKDQLCTHTELLDIINSNLEIYNEEECHKLYDVLKGSSENKDYTEILAVKVFQRCNISVKYELLDKQFSKNCFYDMQESAEFSQMLIETFNKLVIQPDADLSDVLTLFLQNPRQVYSKLFNLALENPQQTDIMLKVVKLIEKYSSHYYETEMDPCIIKVTQKTFELDLETDVKQNNLIKFVCGLKDIDIIPGSKLLLLLIMPNMHTALLNKNTNSLNIQIKLLSTAYTLEDLMQYRAPMLAMLAQVFDVVRWKIHTFTTLAPIALQSAITLQKSLIDTYNNIVPDNEGMWLRNKVKKSHPLNMYYYRHLWNPPGKNFLEIITGKDITTSMEQITMCLTQILCSCNQEEWCDIWDSLSVLEDSAKLTVFHEAILAISIAESTHSTYNTWLCLLYCCRIFIYIIRYKFFKEPLTNSQVAGVVQKIATLPVVKRGKNEDIETLLLPLLSYLAEKRNDYSFDLNSCNHLKQKNLDKLLDKIFIRTSV